MTVIRLLHVDYPPEKADEAARSWKEKCGPLMRREPGCLAERLLRGQDVPHEFVSYSEWDGEDSIRRYLESSAYHQIRDHHRSMGGGHVSVRLYVAA
jgi:heme-degrading monooxygenase HmoA